MPAFLSWQSYKGTIKPLYRSTDSHKPEVVLFFIYCWVFFWAWIPSSFTSPEFSRSLDILISYVFQSQGFSVWFKTHRWLHRTGWTWSSWHGYNQHERLLIQQETVTKTLLRETTALGNDVKNKKKEGWKPSLKNKVPETHLAWNWSKASEMSSDDSVVGLLKWAVMIV